ncbi:peroxiredoxin family protein [Occallatibacter savannae]|uniref:peroxiredoxin family protein n=1 Tax=Occallatibacter savannae TaxID=1002691 RepID=UPI0013A585B3|nr:TlpA disulfide reductase family protein [Occallatibacter savannae]
MKRFPNLLLGLAATALAGLSTIAAQSPSAPPQGRWDATFTLNQTAIPFRLDVSGEGSSLVGTLYNGDLKQTTTSAQFENGKLTLNFDHYLTRIVASVQDGKLTGEVDGRFEADRYIANYPFSAVRHVDQSTVAAENAPEIGGIWEIEHETQKGEKAWRFVVHQHGGDVSASILRVDGDTGALVGSYKDNKFVLSHFDGSRPLVAEVTAQPDGSLHIQLRGAYTPADPLVAWRPEVARSKGLPEPADFTTHTTLRDRNERFSFSFPDVNGKLVSSEDPRFKGKVYLAIVTGTWCPNCHDEAQYLVQLYSKYHSKGLEIVALDFEEPEQQQELHRAKAFIKKYNIPYTYLIAGAPAEMWEKVPQALNLNTWPATLFVGKDGRVRKIHSGFAAPASGRFNSELQAEFTNEIDQLLSENPVQRASSEQVGRAGN